MSSWTKKKTNEGEKREELTKGAGGREGRVRRGKRGERRKALDERKSTGEMKMDR